MYYYNTIIMKISKVLAKEAQKKGICESWYKELRTLEDKQAMLAMYVKGIDFCLSQDYPSNDFIRANFKGMMESFGIFLDDNINIVNFRRCIALGNTKGRVEVGSYGICEIFAKHESNLAINVKNNAFVEIDVFDNSVVHVHAQDCAKVHINRYEGGKVTTDTSGNAVIKIVEKYKKTY
jgi:hypothetical protein